MDGIINTLLINFHLNLFYKTVEIECSKELSDMQQLVKSNDLLEGKEIQDEESKEGFLGCIAKQKDCPCIGYIYGFPEEPKSNIFCIDSLEVAKDKRGSKDSQGLTIGKKLLQKMETNVEEKGLYSELQLVVIKENKDYIKLIKYYEEAGFKLKYKNHVGWADMTKT